MNIHQDQIIDALGMFAFLAVELTVLFLVISYLVGILQEYIPPEKIKNLLAGKNGRGYLYRKTTTNKV